MTALTGRGHRMPRPARCTNALGEVEERILEPFESIIATRLQAGNEGLPCQHAE
jgi:hypothetical protein